MTSQLLLLKYIFVTIAAADQNNVDFLPFEKNALRNSRHQKTKICFSFGFVKNTVEKNDIFFRNHWLHLKRITLQSDHQNTITHNCFFGGFLKRSRSMMLAGLCSKCKDIIFSKNETNFFFKIHKCFMTSIT